MAAKERPDGPDGARDMKTKIVIEELPMQEHDDPGYVGAVALDAVVAWIVERGCSDEELRERFEESLERAHEDADEPV